MLLVLGLAGCSSKTEDARRVGIRCMKDVLPRARLRAHSRVDEVERSGVDGARGVVACERAERGGVCGGQGVFGEAASVVG